MGSEMCIRDRYSPVNLSASRNGGGDIIIEWERRDRRAFDPSGAKPMSELSEAYETTVISGAGRTLSSTSEVVSYAATDQTADGLSLTATSIEIEVFQISQNYGRGTGRRKTVTIT